MKKIMKEHIVFVENVKKDKSYIDFDIEAVIDELKDNGFNVTKKAIIHNFEAWKSGFKSGYKDEVNGYFLFTPYGCDSIRFYATELTGEDWEKTYKA